MYQKVCKWDSVPLGPASSEQLDVRLAIDPDPTDPGGPGIDGSLPPPQRRDFPCTFRVDRPTADQTGRKGGA